MVVVGAALAIACGSLPPPESRGSFSFGVFGDGPYRWTELGRFDRLMQDVNRSDLSFFVHIGDVLWYPCSDEALADRRDALRGIGVPVVYTPGDNEWSDCHERIAGRYDPLDRLRAVRRIFFRDTLWSEIGALRPTRQSADSPWAEYVENIRWEMGTIVFATMHLVGSGSDLAPFNGRTDANDAEAQQRWQAALAWMADAFRVAGERNARAVVLAMHGNLGFDPPLDDPDVYGPIRRALAEHAVRWGKPVLVIHGDWHELHIDQALVDADGTAVPNVTRLETFGSPDIGWVRVFVDTLGPALFSFEPRKMPRHMLWW
jgi:hypothetical protein